MEIYTLWTFNDVTDNLPLKKTLRGLYSFCGGAFHRERPLKKCKLKFAGTFQNATSEAIKTLGAFPGGLFL